MKIHVGGAELYVAESHNVGDPTPFLGPETARVAELQRTGTVGWCLLKADRSGAILLVQTADEASARAALDSLPLVENGITSFTLTQVFAL